MPRSHSPYPPEFRQQMVELVRAGRTPNELAQEFEPTAESIRNWVKQAEIPSLRSGQALAKATAWIAAAKDTARETGSIPDKSSSL
jgi:transposase